MASPARLRSAIASRIQFKPEREVHCKQHPIDRFFRTIPLTMHYTKDELT
jgi:hypothetical protein